MDTPDSEDVSELNGSDVGVDFVKIRANMTECALSNEAWNGPLVSLQRRRGRCEHIHLTAPAFSQYSPY